jgi:prepilin-type N-terminal cleavage/methylation domain-containing protein/prepilin-type processing-associated H-X9-DG protein
MTRRAFSLVELLVVIAIISILCALLLPTLASSKEQGKRAQCTSNQKQLALAAQMYWDENDDMSFPYLSGATNGGKVYWFGWIKAGAEGERDFVATYGAIYPYLAERGVEICPSLDYRSSIYKLKAKGAAYGYGYNRLLGGKSLRQCRRPEDTALFADSAQVNDFQAPASPENPMLEEFYYFDDEVDSATVHFRHRGKANVSFCDGHIAAASPEPNSLDARLPGQTIGRLPAVMVVP